MYQRLNNHQYTFHYFFIGTQSELCIDRFKLSNGMFLSARIYCIMEEIKWVSQERRFTYITCSVYNFCWFSVANSSVLGLRKNTHASVGNFIVLLP